MPTKNRSKRRQRDEESQQLMADHGTGITDGLASVENVAGGQLLVDVDGIKFQMARGVGEELLASLTKALRPFAGYSIFDDIMLMLDVVIDRLMAGEEADDGQDKGRAEAYTMTLAIIRGPHTPDYDAEKKRQMIRYKKRMSDEFESENRRGDHRRSQLNGIEE